MRRIVVLVAVCVCVAALVAALAIGVGGAGSASAASDGQILSASLVPDLGPNAEPTIAGVVPGGLPWVLRAGHSTLTRDGDLTVSVEGLLIPTTGTTGPVTMVTASVVCANGVVLTTSPASLSSHGNAQLEQRVSLPAQCVGPIVLVRAFLSGSSKGWLAASGV
jgi:hypothetical protein